MSERMRYWQRRVAQLESSGLSRAVFCRRRQLNYHTMTYWVKRLANLDGPGASGEPTSFSALLFVPYYWRAGAYTVPEYLGKRYSQPVRVIEALLWGSFLVCCLAIFFWASGVMINTYVGWPIWLGILLTAVTVGILRVPGCEGRRVKPRG